MRLHLSKTKKIFLLFLTIFFLAVPFMISYYVASMGKNNIVNDLSQVKNAEVAIILGARVYPDDSVSVVLSDRLETGLELYKDGKVNKLLLSGDHGQTEYDEVNAMRKYILKAGVPAEDIFLDHAGFNTYDSMYRARDVFKVNKAVVVTNEFHLPRAVFLANTLGIDAQGIVADKTWYRGEEYLLAREFLARCKAFLQAKIINSKPKYLGPAIPISGDGRNSWDEI